MTKFHYIHHSCFMLEHEKENIIFDPFLDDNPSGVQTKDIKVSSVLVTHAHFDHLGDAYKIAKENNAKIISTAGLIRQAKEVGCRVHAMNIGGCYEYSFGKVRITPAFHDSGIPGGIACGFIVNFYGTTIYYAGDTGIFGDMKLLGELEDIDYAILPIGDNFTMGPSDAVKAVQLLGANKVIPVHYNTWPIIAQDPMQFKTMVESQTLAQVYIVKPGESITIY